LTAKQVGYNL